MAEELPLAWMAIQHVEVKRIPQGGAYRYVPTVFDGEKVVTFKAQ